MKKLIALLFLVPLFVFAQSTDQRVGSAKLQKQIQNLLKQIQLLQQQVATLQAELGKQPEKVTPTDEIDQSDVLPESATAQLDATAPELIRPLSRGASGNDVRDLQEFLAKDKDVYPEGLLTGYFGPATEAAVKRWQKKHEIEPRGIVGPKTIAKFQELGRGVKEVVQGLITKGAGKSGIVPPGLLRAPGIQKKLEVTITATSSTAASTAAAAISMLVSTATTSATATSLIATTTPATATATSSTTTPAPPAIPTVSSSGTGSGIPSTTATSTPSVTPATPATPASGSASPPPSSPAPVLVPTPTPPPATLSSCTSVDFEDDPYVGSNITNDPSHVSWVNSKGLDITGTPGGYVWTTRMGGGAGQSGVVVGFGSPDFSEQDQGISDNEIVTLALLNNTAGTVTITVASTPSSESSVNNQSSIVVMDAFDGADTLLGSATKTFTGVTNGAYTPSTLSISAAQASIRKITLKATQHPYGGVWIEKVACSSNVTATDTAPSPTPTAQSSPPPITVMSPNGGSAWDVYHYNQSINYQLNGVSRIGFKLLKGTQVVYSNSAPITTNSTTLSLPPTWDGLPSAQYNSVGSGNDYKIRVFDWDHPETYDDSDSYFSIPTPDITPPVVSSVLASSITSDSAVITWTTDEPATGFVNYGSTPTNWAVTPTNTSYTASHSFTLSNLAGNTPYTYRIYSVDAVSNGPQGYPPEHTFTTLSGPVSCSGINLALNDGKTTYIKGVDNVVNFSWACAPGGSANVNIILQKPGSLGQEQRATLTTNSSPQTSSIDISGTGYPVGTYDLIACFNACGSTVAQKTFSISSSTSSSVDTRTKNLASISQALDAIREKLLKLLRGL